MAPQGRPKVGVDAPCPALRLSSLHAVPLYQESAGGPRDWPGTALAPLWMSTAPAESNSGSAGWTLPASG